MTPEAYDKIKDHHVIVQTKDWTETFLALDKSEKKITFYEIV